jgi:hypothetical protein
VAEALAAKEDPLNSEDYTKLQVNNSIMGSITSHTRGTHGRLCQLLTIVWFVGWEQVVYPQAVSLMCKTGFK